MYPSSAPLPLLPSILLLTAAVRSHPQAPLPSSVEPPAAFPLESSGITARKDTEEVGFGTPQFLKAIPLDGGLTGVDPFLSSTSGSTGNGNVVELRINQARILHSDEISNSSGEENLISQSNVCDQGSNSLKSRRLRNRNPGQELPSSCLTNPIERNSQSEPQIEPDKERLGAGSRELNQGKNIPVDVPDFDFPTEGKGYMPTMNSNICPPEKLYPLCADDEAISVMPEEMAYLLQETTYMLYPAYACTFPIGSPCSCHRRDKKIRNENVRKRK